MMYRRLEHSAAHNHIRPAQRRAGLPLAMYRNPATTPTRGTTSAAANTPHVTCVDGMSSQRTTATRSAMKGTLQYAQTRFMDAFSLPHS